jgi:hypothetical protein
LLSRLLLVSVCLFAVAAIADRALSGSASSKLSATTSVSCDRGRLGPGDGGWTCAACGVARQSDGGVVSVPEGECDVASVGDISNAVRLEQDWKKRRGL